MVGEGSTSSSNPFDGLTISPVTNFPKFAMRDDAGTAITATGTIGVSAVVNDGLWHQLVGVRTVSGSTTTLNLYVDGNLYGTAERHARNAHA